jgi:hypothetical protein
MLLRSLPNCLARSILLLVKLVLSYDVAFIYGSMIAEFVLVYEVVGRC